MENRELIIPARLDSKDAAAGLRAIEESAHAADDLGQAADAASARFRKAHESVQSAAQEYLRLTQSLQQSADMPTPSMAGPPIGAGPRPDEWLESADGLLAAGSRRGGPEDGRPGEPGRNPEPSVPPPASMGGSNPPPGGASAGDDRSAGASLGPDQGGWGGAPPRITAGARNRGPGGMPGLSEGLADPAAPRGAASPLRVPAAGSGDTPASFEGRNIIAQARGRQSSVEGADDPGAGAGRMAREAVSDYAEWMNGPRDGNRGGGAINRSAGPAISDGEAGIRTPGAGPVRSGAEALQGAAGPLGGLNPLEGVWGTRAASPAMPAFDRSPADGPAMRPTREPADAAPGVRGPESRLGGASFDVIERLLREQNELIRQDLQRNAHPPIAAPPPMRGGGIRM